MPKLHRVKLSALTGEMLVMLAESMSAAFCCSLFPKLFEQGKLAPLDCYVSLFLQAVIEEADVWWADVKKAISDFEKDIISTISSKKGSIIASEKLLRYMEEKNRQRVSPPWQILRLVCHLTSMLVRNMLVPILLCGLQQVFRLS